MTSGDRTLATAFIQVSFFKAITDVMVLSVNSQKIHQAVPSCRLDAMSAAFAVLFIPSDSGCTAMVVDPHQSMPQRLCKTACTESLIKANHPSQRQCLSLEIIFGLQLGLSTQNGHNANEYVKPSKYTLESAGYRAILQAFLRNPQMFQRETRHPCV